MRVFDSYSFNIVDKVSFQKTRPYLEQMLADLGYGYKNLGFSLTEVSSTGDMVIDRILKKYPSLKKYFYMENFHGSPDPYLSSFSVNWREGNVYADKEDREDIFEVYSKIPRPFNIPFGKMIYDGINWFDDSDDTIAVKYKYFQGIHPTADDPFKSNSIVHFRRFDDGRKYNIVVVCIEVTGELEPRSSKEIVSRLVPYLGEPRRSERECIFPQEELTRLWSLGKSHRELLDQTVKDVLPEPKHMVLEDPYVVPYIPEIPHVADKATLNRVFKGSVFKRGKGTGNWLHKYECTDAHGFLYEAYIQKITCENQFRIWLEISGYNFSIKTCDIDYYVTQEGESSDILKEFVQLCVRLYEEYGAELAKDFGDTPPWYRGQV